MENLITLNVGFDKTKTHQNEFTELVEHVKYFFISCSDYYLAIVWGSNYWEAKQLTNIDNILIIDTVEIEKQDFIEIYCQILAGRKISTLNSDFNIIKFITGTKLPKTEVSNEYQSLIKQMEYDVSLISDIRKMQQFHGDKYCCINRKREISINLDAKNDKYSIFVQIACEGSELFDFWTRKLTHPSFKDFEIVTVDEFCNIYVNKIISDHLNKCKSMIVYV